MDYLKLFIEVAQVSRPTYRDKIKLTDLNTPLTATELDSLDCLMIGMYLCEIYGIDEEVSKTMQPSTPQGYFDFCNEHKTREPSSAEEALSWIV